MLFSLSRDNPEIFVVYLFCDEWINLVKNITIGDIDFLCHSDDKHPKYTRYIKWWKVTPRTFCIYILISPEIKNAR